ncbi:hypothetical protein TKK_0003812 [Trichogramma kaykai]
MPNGKSTFPPKNSRFAPLSDVPVTARPTRSDTKPEKSAIARSALELVESRARPPSNPIPWEPLDDPRPQARKNSQKIPTISANREKLGTVSSLGNASASDPSPRATPGFPRRGRLFPETAGY